MIMQIYFKTLKSKHFLGYRNDSKSFSALISYLFIKYDENEIEYGLLV
jgi:hypothetical protein